MTTSLVGQPTQTSSPDFQASKVGRKGNIVVRWITSTDHKTIGYMYLIASFIFFLLAGVMALVIRAQLFEPGLHVVATKEQYNQLFTMHGTIMLLMFATPLFSGFANAIMPLQIGAPDVAFPRLNGFAFWLYLFGSLIAVGGFLTPQGAASFGWFAYAPLSDTTFTPGLGGTLWVFGLGMTGFSTILGAVNFITTIITMRAPGLTMFRMSIFTWNTLVTALLVLMAFPVLATALFGLGLDRVFDAQIFNPANGGALLWQHLFWFFGHPEVYIIALPFFGIVSEVFPVFSRKPIFGYKTLVYATISIAALSVTVWAHHMYVTGGVLLPWFSLMTMLIAVPTGVKIFNWVGTMWRGSVTFETPLLWALGFLITFTFGGLTGVILASPPLDFHVSDSYFVVAHFHYVVFGTVVFAMFSGFYFWWPKWTGKMLNERLGKIHFWLLFIGFHTTFLIQHWLGVIGMPRRYATYLPNDGFTWMNQLSTIGSMILAISFLPFIFNVYVTARNAPKVAVNDPWGYGRSLEWATSCPPPRHNFTSIPRIRSESPAFDLNHPEAGVPIGVGPAKDAPDAPTYDAAKGEVK
ncbi:MULTISPECIES: aa3-type cytochrome oxidase subunit I [Curtobacterium]|jgi:cytochrome c oxidase subunit 1|uniref:aa3-type cytochrome oxidase subunit I n=1 Tax=Curtobacterium TaxID=2034 RepID=UPI0004890CE1|nr:MULTISPECIES: cytochrome c oxidase subunit I [Curtobacterium]MCE0457056.1 cytochrome c oxidase subunit I [Curtobacterium allii]MCS0470052.1 cytochrome c oxidase subunit I [Curtobacterium flaccumfaciens pv. betae]MCS0475310.1 cytochrome c oxidase subunit I [Curtobacterium flaccumfaciens pv. betae]MCS0476900.1 cytochrome c oxidase subunit I [Curtobacterium flaccumfaciens pv. betae]MCS0481144.1 cytochrome c oxidase subunit I [Curtobacterium flaccumfaciens pv. betae]